MDAKPQKLWYPYLSRLWKELIEVGKKIENPKDGITHSMTQEQIKKFVRIFYFHPQFQKQLLWDLTVPKYRLFDELGMMLRGRTRGYGESETIRIISLETTKKLAKIYIEVAKKARNRAELYKMFFERIGIPRI